LQEHEKGRNRIVKALVVAEIRGNRKAVESLREIAAAEQAKVLFCLGGVLGGGERVNRWRILRQGGEAPTYPDPVVLEQEKEDVQFLDYFFDTLASLEIPCFHVPGWYDAPARLYWQSAVNHEVITGRVQGVHLAPALFEGEWVVAGFGGRIVEAENHEDYYVIEHPAWEAEFGLNFLRRFDRRPILLFHETGLPHEAMHRVIDHFIKEYNPQFAFVTSPDGRVEDRRIGRTLVVTPGRLADGSYAVVDLRQETVKAVWAGA
jgi:Icc-related predicted phosphoesterase